MLKDYMFPSHTQPGVLPSDAADAPFLAADRPPEDRRDAERCGQGSCTISLSGGGTDVSAVVHLVHPLEVHPAVETDLVSGGLILMGSTPDARAAPCRPPR